MNEKQKQPEKTDRELNDDELEPVSGGVSSYQVGGKVAPLAMPDLDAGAN